MKNKIDFNWKSEPATFDNLKNVFIVIHPSDNNNPVSNSGSFARETEIKESTLTDAIALSDSLQDRFGDSYIAKLVEYSPEHRGLAIYESGLFMITEKGGSDECPIVWEKIGKYLPKFAGLKEHKVYGKIKLMKIEKYLKYDNDFFKEIEAGFFK